MKKSEMIKLIQSVILNNIDLYIDPYSIEPVLNNPHTVAVKILYAIREAGMRVPLGGSQESFLLAVRYDDWEPEETFQ